jgi:hypothetical protein
MVKDTCPPTTIHKEPELWGHLACTGTYFPGMWLEATYSDFITLSVSICMCPFYFSWVDGSDRVWLSMWYPYKNLAGRNYSKRLTVIYSTYYIHIRKSGKWMSHSTHTQSYRRPQKSVTRVEGCRVAPSRKRHLIWNYDTNSRKWVKLELAPPGLLSLVRLSKVGF